jgi:FkbM family methyltransferase
MKLNLYQKLIAKIYSRQGIPMPVIELYFFVKKFLPADPIILEAGAHMGFDTIGLSRIWPKAKILAIEPVPNVYEDLVKRVGKLSNVKTLQLALGEKNGVAEMFVSSGDSTASSSILAPTIHLEMFPSVNFNHKIEVPITRLDDLAAHHEIPAIDLMWLDMQGYEPQALEGAGNCLSGVSVIYTELCKSELYAGMMTQNHFIQFLEQNGFKLIWVTHDDEVNEGVFINPEAIAKRKLKKR